MERTLPRPLVIPQARRTAAVIAGVTVAALVIRAVPIGWSGLWRDEVGQALVATLPLPEMLEGIRSHAAAAPLDYFGTRLVTSVVTDPTVGPRLWAVVVGTLGIPLAFLAGRAWIGSGTVTAALAALSPMLVFYSTEARFYALATTLAFGYLWAVRRSSIGVAVFAAAGVLTMYSFGFLLLAGAAWCVQRREWRRVAAHAAAPLALGPWAWYALEDQAVRSFTAPSWTVWPAAVDTLTSWFSYRAPLGLTLVVTAFGVTLVVLGASRRVWPLVAIPIIVTIGMILLAQRAGYFWAPRHAILAIPPLLIVIAGGLARRPLLAVATVIAFALSLPFVYADRAEGWEDWRGAASWLGPGPVWIAEHERDYLRYYATVETLGGDDPFVGRQALWSGFFGSSPPDPPPGWERVHLSGDLWGFRYAGAQ